MKKTWRQGDFVDVHGSSSLFFGKKKCFFGRGGHEWTVNLKKQHGSKTASWIRPSLEETIPSASSALMMTTCQVWVEWEAGTMELCALRARWNRENANSFTYLNHCNIMCATPKHLLNLKTWKPRNYLTLSPSESDRKETLPAMELVKIRHEFPVIHNHLKIPWIWAYPCY